MKKTESDRQADRKGKSGPKDRWQAGLGLRVNGTVPFGHFAGFSSSSPSPCRHATPTSATRGRGELASNNGSGSAAVPCPARRIHCVVSRARPASYSLQATATSSCFPLSDAATPSCSLKGEIKGTVSIPNLNLENTCKQASGIRHQWMDRHSTNAMHGGESRAWHGMACKSISGVRSMPISRVASSTDS